MTAIPDFTAIVIAAAGGSAPFSAHDTWVVYWVVAIGACLVGVIWGAIHCDDNYVEFAGEMLEPSAGAVIGFVAGWLWPGVVVAAVGLFVVAVVWSFCEGIAQLARIGWKAVPKSRRRKIPFPEARVISK